MTDLAHKNVLVTGASGGLGQALSEAFAAQKSRVIIAARNQERRNAAAEEMERNRRAGLRIAVRYPSQRSNAQTE